LTKDWISSTSKRYLKWIKVTFYEHQQQDELHERDEKGNQEIPSKQDRELRERSPLDIYKYI
jgi:hypothetical protein